VFLVRKNFPVFVTGASGFIGGQLARRLLADGRRVRVLARKPLPELEALGVEVIPGDLHDPHALERGCRSAETVFHVAGRVGVWGPPEDFFRVNVDGTRRLLAACREAKVPRLVYTSSPSVVYTGGDLRNVNESAPLCTQAPCAYPTSKAAAEREVLAAHGKDLATIALRPHLVWGPGDKNLVPRVIALARAGKLKIIGPGRNKVDLTHISNVIDAHLLAEGALLQCHPIGDIATASPSVERHPLGDIPSKEGVVGGRAYFITNGEPVVLWDWINTILRGIGAPEIKSRVPLPVAYAAGGLLETVWRILGRAGDPPMTRFIAKEMATDHWFDLTAARRDLGYHPLMTMEQGTAKLIAHYQAGNPF
jgi:nucleoside-diphosphate-sugar epimerase